MRQRIRSEGPITFDIFMEMALYHPGYGFYMSGKERFGPKGDFYTSPHLHPIFGKTIGIQIEEIRRIMGEPEDFTVLEIGAGKGYLAEGVISYLHEELNLQEGWRYVIVERSPGLQQAQQDLLSKYSGFIEWKRSLDELDSIRGCVISNELLDSFPVHLVQVHRGFKEIYIDIRDEGFKEVMRELSRPELSAYIYRYRIPEIDGYRTEINLMIKDFLVDINSILDEGFIITIDYGYSASEYYSPERTNGTLLCYYKHTLNEDPFLNIGNQDITAHVNFSSLKDWGNDLGIKSIGYTPQGTFLVSLGIDEMISREMETAREFLNEIPKIKGLIFGMGDTHKVMVQYKGKRRVNTLKGFGIRNRADLL
jgi:SAM-dependent MidA family methyltransferase